MLGLSGHIYFQVVILVLKLSRLSLLKLKPFFLVGLSFCCRILNDNFGRLSR